MSLSEGLSALPSRASRAFFVSLSHRRGLARVASRMRITRPLVARFVAGETLDDALGAIADLESAGFCSTVDILGEAVTSAEHATAAADSYLTTIPALAARGLSRNVSIKLTQMGLDVDGSLCRDNVRRIVEAARESGGFVRIDMEDHTRTDATLEIWEETFRASPNVGIVLQSALRRTAADLERVIDLGGRVRLCKGAYSEPAAVAFPTKREVDERYVSLMERLLLAGDHPAIATHDPRILRHAIAFARSNGIEPDRFEFQMLYGVRRDLQAALVRRGYAVRIYVPFGTEWYPYFMRRLAERPANVAFMLRSLVKEEVRRFR